MEMELEDIIFELMLDVGAPAEDPMETLKEMRRHLRAAVDDSTDDSFCLQLFHYIRAENLLKSEPRLVPVLEDPLWREVLVYLASGNRWSNIQTVLTRGTGKICWNLLVEKAGSEFVLYPEAFVVFDLLSARCLEMECSCMEDYVSYVTTRGLVDQFKMLVYSENTGVRQIVVDNLVNLVLNSSSCRLSPVLRPGSVRHPGSYLNDCLTVACEAGLFTVRVGDQSFPLDSNGLTAMDGAVISNQPDVVRFLYHAGATSNSDLYQLSCNPDLKAKTKEDPANVPKLPRLSKDDDDDDDDDDVDYPTHDDVDAAKNIQCFLSRVASIPRSLKTLCLLQLSGHLGWGHGRESRIEQLEIPDNLKQDLKFKDQKVLLN